MSHYIAYFTVERSAAYNPNGEPSRQLRAVCGEWIDYTDHTAEPTCPACVAWLEKEAADDAETEAKSGVEHAGR